MNMIVLGGIAALAIFLSAGVQGQPAAGLRAACAADLEKYCADIPSGHGLRLKCLDDNKEKLSDSCRTGLTGFANMAETMRVACGDDIQKFCANSEPGTARMTCMNANRDQLSAQCKATLASLPGRNR